MREKYGKKKRLMESEENRRQKSQENQVRGKKYRLIVLESCEALVRSVLTFGMNNINKTKVKELRLLLRYHFGS